MNTGETVVRSLLASALSLLVFLVACSGGISSQTGSGGGVTYIPNGDVLHIVVIFGENVSFDHYFGTYPAAANKAGEPPFTAAAGTPVPDGLSGTLLTANPNATNPNNGAAATNPFRLDRAQAATADQDHAYAPEQTAFDGGAMDRFPYAVGSADSEALAARTSAAKVAASKGLTMGYYDGNTVTALWNYAQHYALNDHSFGTTFGPSTVGAINLISGQTNGAVAGQNADGVLVSDGNGGFTLISDGGPNGDICSNTTQASVSMSGTNIGDLLTAAGISWGWFAGGFNLSLTNANGTTGCRRSTASAITGVQFDDYLSITEPFQYYTSTQNLQHTRPVSIAAIGTNGDGANHQYDIQDFATALAAGNLPGVSFLKASSYQDGHAGFSDPLDEQKFIVDTVNAIEHSKFWPNTVIILAYDDSDGWYDHVMHLVNGSATAQDTLYGSGLCGNPSVNPVSALPGVNSATAHAQGRCGYGPRMPLLVISPWARKNYIDSTVTDQTSIIRFIEDAFLGGQRIGRGSFDSIAGTLSNMLDFSQSSPQNDAVVLLNDTTGEVTSGN
jgi:phospholipase C